MNDFYDEEFPLDLVKSALSISRKLAMLLLTMNLNPSALSPVVFTVNSDHPMKLKPTCYCDAFNPRTDTKFIKKYCHKPKHSKYLLQLVSVCLLLY